VQTAVRHITEKDAVFWRYTDQPLAPGDYVSLRVEDDGEGMDLENIVKIFDPFFTTKFTGRGLGLAAVLGIVRSHQGGLSVSSQSESGTVFELLLPASTKTELTNSQPDVMEKETAFTGLVLVIDDERAVREAIADILELEGIGSLTAASGDEGLAQYQAHASEIDLVLLDLSMPGKSGRETFVALQELDPNVRIMLSSGYSEADATQGFATPPLVGFLQKPYRLDTFIQQLQKILQK
jgi:CheY-like chemotaxis protein